MASEIEAGSDKNTRSKVKNFREQRRQNSRALIKLAKERFKRGESIQQTEPTFQIVEKTYKILDEEITLTVHQRASGFWSPEEQHEDITGLERIWGSSVVLCIYLKKFPETFADKRILELGCGGGLVGTYLAKQMDTHNITDLYLTDGNEKATQFAHQSAVKYNKNVHAMQLWWGTEHGENFKKEHGEFDLILAADCVYEQHSLLLLFESIYTLVKEDGCVIFAFRPYLEVKKGTVMEKLQEHAKTFGFQSFEVVDRNRYLTIEEQTKWKTNNIVILRKNILEKN